MPRNKVKLAFIESNSERKASYKKRQKGFLKKAHELNTICDVEMATVIYSPYHNEPKMFPNHDAAINIFTKFRDFPELEKSKNMVTQEKFTKQRIEKIEEQLQKVRKENKLREFTNKMYEMLNGKDIVTGMHPHELNDISYVINQKLKQVCEGIKAKADIEGSTSYDSQSINGPIAPGGTSSEGSKATLLAPDGALVSVVPLVTSSTISGGTNFEGRKASMLVHDVAPILMIPPAAHSMISSTAPSQVSQPMFHLVTPSRTPPVDPLWVSPSPLFSSQTFSPIPQQMDLIEAHGMVPPTPPTTMVFPTTSPMITLTTSAPISPPMTSHMDTSMNILPMSASMSMNNYPNYFVDFSQGFALSEILDWNNDDAMTLLDDSYFNNKNIQELNHNNNF